MATTHEIQVHTQDGVCPARLFVPLAAGPHPGVLFYMDGLGARPALWDMAARFADSGYVVLLPELFYRTPYAPFDAKTAFAVPEERARVIELVRSVDGEKVMRDTPAFLDVLASRPDVAKGPFGVVGYCLGGRQALIAAGTFPDRFAAAASIHGGRIGAEDPWSPAVVAPKARAEIYAAIAQDDATHTPEMHARLEKALTEAGVRHTLEHYPANHGFAVPDTAVYDEPSAERHVAAVLELFGRALRH